MNGYACRESKFRLKPTFPERHRICHLDKCLDCRASNGGAEALHCGHFSGVICLQLLPFVSDHIRVTMTKCVTCVLLGIVGTRQLPCLKRHTVLTLSALCCNMIYFCSFVCILQDTWMTHCYDCSLELYREDIARAVPQCNVLKLTLHFQNDT